MRKSIGMVILFLGAIWTFLCFRDGIAAMLPLTDLYGEETDVHDIGYFDMVEVDIYAVYDYFVSEVTTENGVKKDEDFFYIIPAWDASGEEMYYIGVKVDEDDVGPYNKISDITYNYIMGISDELGDTTVHETGCLKKMDDKYYKHFVAWFEEAEWFESEEELEKYVLPLYLDPVNRGRVRNMLLVGFGMLAVGGGLVIWGIMADRKYSKKVKSQEYVVINGVSYPKSVFAHVNTCIVGKEKIFAIQELRDITGLGLEEAKEVVENWSKYYLV